jgi:hypothetical protein
VEQGRHINFGKKLVKAMSEEKLEDYFSEAIKNIRDDRAITSKLLLEIMQYINGNEERHQTSGQTAAKYVETLQRSNEQLVKMVALLHKSAPPSNGLTAKDKDEIFDILNNNGGEIDAP